MLCRYFVALVELCAEICLGRHKGAMLKVLLPFPADVLLKLLSDNAQFPAVRHVAVLYVVTGPSAS